MPLFLRILLGLGGLVALAIVLVLLFENRLIFFPAKYPEGDWGARERSGIPTEEVFFPATDGTRLHAWYLRPQARSEAVPAEGAGAAQPRFTVLCLHGNAGNLTDRYDWACEMVDLPADVFLMDYRGYGRSEGRPDEKGVYADAAGAWRYLTGTRGVAPSRIVIVGQSLGGAVACELASREPGNAAAALVLQSTFTNVRDMARVAYPWLPVGGLIRSRFDNLSNIARVRAPVLIIHGHGDEVVPFSMADRLMAAAHEPKQFVAYDGSGHNDLVADHGREIVVAMREFLDRSGGAHRVSE